METFKREKILSCIHYKCDIVPSVEICKLDQGQTKEKIFCRNEIAFILKGEIRFAFRNLPEKVFREGEFIFVPVGGTFRYTVLKKTRILIIRLNENIKLCEGYLIEELYTQGKSAIAQKRKEICVLPVNRPLRLFLNGLSETALDGLNCRYYFDTKSRELFILLRAYYSLEQLRDFFSLIISPDTAFSEYIRANHQHYKTAKELAEAMHMTPKLFSKKFIKVFGEPSIHWMKKEKALSVYSDLHSGRAPLAQLVDKYRFSSQSHLNKFCKREFGKNPGEIRKRV